MTVRSVNPYTASEIARYAVLDEEALRGRLRSAAEAFERHRSTTMEERGGRMHRVADVLEEQVDRWAELMTAEMGKPVGQARAEARKCAWACRWYADRAPALLADEPVETDAHRSFVAFEPLGPVLAVMPWNFPFWQVFRFAAPAIMAGNVALLKHASNVTGCALAIEEIFRAGGFDRDEFQALVIPSSAVDRVIGDDVVRAATLTGSDAAGRAVGSAAGRAIKPSVLELGGSDPFVVLADADVEAAARTAVTARMQNNGQSCIAAKRFIVERPVLDAFTAAFCDGVRRLSVGDPMDPSTDVGPLARGDLLDEVADQVDRAVKGGAEVLVGGRRGEGPGFFYEPTVLGAVDEGSVAFREEIFGPVASVIVAEDADDALRLANRTPFGLGGAVFTADPARGERFARGMQVGCAFVNGMVKSDPRLPFGGIRESGYGRELAGFGIRAFVNAKSIWIAAAPA
jgi:succinate-semialdehyde dehydrogenase/glutarate-semialdehyde dehydrogenase